MEQILIRDLDDDLVEAYRQQAVRNNRSLEEEIRQAIRSLRPSVIMEREAAVARAREIRAMTPEGVKQTPSEVLVREDRDGQRW